MTSSGPGTVVGDSQELVQGRPADDGIKGEVDLHDVKDDTLCAVVLRRPKRHREGDATAWNDRAHDHTQKMSAKG
jgi:hypothetical protein